MVPVVDRVAQACPDLALDLGDLGQTARPDFLEVLRHEMPDGIGLGAALEILPQPVGAEQGLDEGQLVGGGGPQVEVRGVAAGTGLAALVQRHELQALGDDQGVAGGALAAVVDRVLQAQEQVRPVPVVVRVDQHGTLREQAPVLLADDVDDRIQQRVARADKGGARRAGSYGLVEADPLVAGQDDVARAELAVALA